jgi:FHA domain
MNLRLSITAVSGASKSFEHAGPVVCIGRDAGCELSLQGALGDAVSRQHARIELGAGGATLADVGSSNGTLLNDRLLEGPAPLRVGDRIQLGYTGPTLKVLALETGTSPAASGLRLRQVVLIGSAATAMLALVLVLAVLLRKPKTEESSTQGVPSAEPPTPFRPPDTGKALVSPATTPRVQVSPKASTPRQDPQRQPPPLPPSSPPTPPDPTPPDAPSPEVKEVGAYVALNQWVSVLLQRQGAGYPWTVLRPEQRVSTGQTLVSLPGYRSLLDLDSKVYLVLWGNLPEFSASSPVLESVVMLHAPAAGTDLDFTLDRGRVVIANRKAPPGPAHVRLRFLHESWELELPDEQSEAALEVWGLPQGGLKEAGQSPPTWLHLFVKGRVVVKTPRQTLELRDRSRMTWLNRDPSMPRRDDLPELPAWWTKPVDRKAPEIQKALRSLLDWSDKLGGSNVDPRKGKTADKGEPLVSKIKTQVVEVKDADNQDVGIFFLAALDEVEPLVDFLQDRVNPNVRGVTIFALQSWLSRGARHAGELARILERRGVSKDKAELIVRLLHFYVREDLEKRKTYEELIERLDDDHLLVRNLAFWHLDQLGVGGRLPEEARKIAYDPTWEPEKRRPAVEKWKRLLAEGKVPSLPRP